LVDQQSQYPLGGAPWGDVAGEYEHLHAHGRTLTDLARAVHADLSSCRWSAPH
jgi:hypothetical protein